MKKKSLLLLSLLLMWSLLTACGASASGTMMADTAAAAAEAPMATPMPQMAAPEEAVEAEEMDAGASTAVNAGGLVSGETAGQLGDKIIYTAYAEVETTEFDSSVDQVYKLLDQYGGFVETSAVTGNNYTDGVYGTESRRTANFTLRVPRENYAAMTAALDTVGNVTYLTNSAENITAQYTDTESRMKAYETEEERLLEIMAQAENVEDLIDLESRLSEIRYQKENLTSQLKNWDNQISYSAVSLYLSEVQVLTPEPQEDPTYGQELKEAFISSVKWVGRACKALLKGLVAALPVLLPLAAIIVAVVLICLHQKKKTARKAEEARKAAETGKPEPPRDHTVE